MRAYCTACGAPRSLLEDTPVNLAGQPSKIGGGVATMVGLMILGIGIFVALLLGVFLQAIFPTLAIGWVLGGFIAAVSLFVGAMFLWGGRMLFRSGAESARGAQEQAVLAIARKRGGSVTAPELARVLSIPETEADSILTAMAKRADGLVTLELDDDGTLRYEVHDASVPRVRVSERRRVTTGARVFGENAAADALLEGQAEEEAHMDERRRLRR